MTIVFEGAAAFAFAWAFTRFAGRGLPGAGTDGCLLGVGLTIGVTATGRFSPGTCTIFGMVGAPTARGDTGGWWERWMRTAIQTPPRAISAKMICRSRISPLV